MIAEKEMHEAINSRMLSDSITNLIATLKGKGEPSLSLDGPSSDMLNRITTVPFQTKYAIFFTRNILDTIIETVKNKILDWAILLEENEIVGEGLTFSIEERTRAIQNPQIINYVNNFLGNAKDIQIQEGAVCSEQSTGTVERE